jgi:hypothetical protein
MAAGTDMNEWIEERERSLREFFRLRAGTELIPRGAAESFELPEQRRLLLHPRD